MEERKVYRLIEIKDNCPSIEEVVLSEEEWETVWKESQGWKIETSHTEYIDYDDYGTYEGDTITYHHNIEPRQILIKNGHFTGVIFGNGTVMLKNGRSYGSTSYSGGREVGSHSDTYSSTNVYLVRA